MTFTPPTEYPAEYVSIAKERKAFIYGKHGDAYVGVMEFPENRTQSYRWNHSGHRIETNGKLYEDVTFDLQDLPKTTVSYANYSVISGISVIGSICGSKEQCDRINGGPRLGILKITHTEGQDPEVKFIKTEDAG